MLTREFKNDHKCNNIKTTENRGTGKEEVLINVLAIMPVFRPYVPSQWRIQTLIRGGGGGAVSRNFFRPFEPHFGGKIREVGPPGSATAMEYDSHACTCACATSKDQDPVVQTLDSAIHLASVVQKANSTIQQINFYPVDSAIGFPNTYALDSDLSSG